ncbi:MAG: ubiquinol-cytochrome c reductase iron-sulfur subunit [Pseudomonadales bacterium]|nr:ubiquinol-cytochrome c reductase iron-sulfur subunit [Pseudomonadales bacterium]
MSDNQVNQKRRRLLIGATSAVGAVGVGGVAVPFIGSWSPSARAKAAGAPVKADIGKLEPGQMVIIEWRGKPVFIVRRTKETVANLGKLDDSLRDPTCLEGEQPEYVSDEYRSIKAEYLVLVGICTHLGCSPKYRPELAPEDLGDEWLGGFFCPCHGSRFDLAGRVYKGVPAPTNLTVPPYKYTSDTTLIIGVDEEEA